MELPGVWEGWCLSCSVGSCAGLVPAGYPVGDLVCEEYGVHGCWCIFVQVILVLVCACWCMCMHVQVGNYIYTWACVCDVCAYV